jgi:hypothetical protein
MIFGREPALIAGLIAIGVNLAISFGLGLTAEQVSLINAFVVAGLALLVRQTVTPVAAPELPQGTSVTVVTPGNAPNTTVTV